jgi:5'-3' exonuclease
MIEYEADDALAAAAARFGQDPRVSQIRIASPDKDFCQCVRGERVVLYDRKKKLVTDERGVMERLGVAPQQVPAFLGLVGDTADGIPGIPRWGEKSAAQLLGVYGSIEAIPDDPAVWPRQVRGREALARELSGARTAVTLYEQLATLRVDVPLTESLDDLAYRGPNPELRALCEELGVPDVELRLDRING